VPFPFQVVLSNGSKPSASDTTLPGGGDGLGVGGEAGCAEVPGRVRRLDWRVGDANAEAAAVEQIGQAREEGADGAVDLPQVVKRNVPGQRGRVG
jgi:hypothetical protein